MQFLFFFQFLCPKSIFFRSFRWGIIPLDFVSFPFRTSKLKNDIIYIKYKFSHRFVMVCRWLNIYYSRIKIIIFLNIIIMSIWIILNNLVWTCRECNFCHCWATILCIHPTSALGAKLHETISTHGWKKFTRSCLCKSPFDPRGKSCLHLMDPNLPIGVSSVYRTNPNQILLLHQPFIKDHWNDLMYVNIIHPCLD